jgi:DNA helicase-2/ATP-dependent DNA helicase PcrA
MDLSLAKGLEFDTVILADADPDVYREDRIGRNRLYTAISRAAARVIILAEKELTPLLTGRPGDAGWKKQRLSEESRR